VDHSESLEKMHVIMKKISSGADYQGEEEFMGTLQELQRREARLA